MSNRKTPYGPSFDDEGGFDEAINPIVDDDEDFLNIIRSRLSEEDKREIALIEKVKSVYVRCHRDDLLNETLAKYTKDNLAKRGADRDPGFIFFLSGDSGAGKTAMVRNALANAKLLQPIDRTYGQINPVARLSLSGGGTTLKMVGHQIAIAAGYPLKMTVGQNELWAIRLPEVLHRRHIMLVHIDETQHVLRQTPKDVDRQQLANSIKALADNAKWPVSFILSGLPEITELARLDEQFERRSIHKDLTDVDLPEERVLVERLIERMAGAIDLYTDRLIQSDLPERIAHAAQYRYGRIAQVILAGIRVAIQKRADDLNREHFAYAYLEVSHARGHDEMNPFLTDDWRRLPPGYFLKERRRNG